MGTLTFRFDFLCLVGCPENTTYCLPCFAFILGTCFAQRTTYFVIGTNED